MEIVISTTVLVCAFASDTRMIKKYLLRVSMCMPDAVQVSSCSCVYLLLMLFCRYITHQEVYTACVV